MNQKSTFTKYKSSQKIVVMGAFTSWYHALGVLSYLKANRERLEKVLLVHQEFFGKKSSVDHDLFFNVFSGCIFFDDYLSLDSYVKKNMREQVDVAVVSTSKYPMRLSWVAKKLKRRHEIIVVEEGLGTYRSDFEELKAVALMTRQKKIRTLVFSVFTLSWKKLYFFRWGATYWTNFYPNSTTINADVSNSYRLLIEEIGSRYDVDIQAIGTSIFLSSPFCEMGIYSEEYYFEKLSAAFKDKDHVIVKPHPLEDIEKYKKRGYKLLPPEIPTELLFKNFPESMKVYSFSSTCVYTYYIVTGKKMFRIVALDALYKKLTKSQRSIVDVYSVKV